MLRISRAIQQNLFVENLNNPSRSKKVLHNTSQCINRNLALLMEISYAVSIYTCLQVFIVKVNDSTFSKNIASSVISKELRKS